MTAVFRLGALEGLAAGLLAGLRAGFVFAGTGTFTVLVMVRVVVDPADEPEDPTHTVTDPEPIFEPWLRPELVEPAPEHARAIWESNPTKTAATKMLVKPKLAC